MFTINHLSEAPFGTKGTHYKFEPPLGTEREVVNGTFKTTKTKLICITGMKEYQMKSLEELRFEDYFTNRNGPYQKSQVHFGLNRDTVNRPFGPAHNDQTGNKNTFGLTNNHTFGTTGIFSTTGANPLSTNTTISKSPENKPQFGSSTMDFGFNQGKPSCSRNNDFGSTGRSWFVTPHLFGCSSVLESAKKNTSFGNTSIFCSSKENPFDLGGLASAKPFVNTNLHGCGGNKFSAPATSLNEAVSPTKFSIPQKIQDYSSIESQQSNHKVNLGKLFERPNFTYKGDDFITKWRNEGQIAQRKNKTKLSMINSTTSSTTASCTSKTCSGDGEAAEVLQSIKKSGFNFAALKIPDSDGTVSETYDGEMKKLLTDLQSVIECPVCFGRLDPSVKQCESGHGICGSCFDNVGNKCPTCQRRFLPDKPILLIQILDRLPKLCSFAEKGCDVMLFDKKDEHEMFCRFRPTSCKFESCEWTGTVEAVVDHVRTCDKSSAYNLCEMHFPKVKLVQHCKLDKKVNQGSYSAIIYRNQLYWMYFHRDCHSKITSYKFYHVAPSKSEQKFYLVVSFVKGEIEFKTSVAASLETNMQTEETRNNETSFFLSDEDLERFYDSETETYFYTLKVIEDDNLRNDEKK